MESIHIIDFDLGEGNQWPQVMEAISQMKKYLIITSIKLDQDQDLQFHQTMWQLYNFARTFGLNLKVQEMKMGRLVKLIEGRTLGKEFLVFNCMVGLPHIGRTRKPNQVTDFLKVAKLLLAEN
ncbi:putative transcription factor GRAS family [Helianthus debilis subsp. tardiflorus]